MLLFIESWILWFIQKFTPKEPIQAQQEDFIYLGDDKGINAIWDREDPDSF